jgi:hypothetical protein
MKAEGEAEGENIAKNQPNNNSIAWARAKSKHKKNKHLRCASEAKHRPGGAQAGSNPGRNTNN